MFFEKKLVIDYLNNKFIFLKIKLRKFKKIKNNNKNVKNF